MNSNYNHKKIEKKWAEEWVKDKIFTPDLEKAKNPYYALFMFPYPSAEGLHIGNFYAFTCVDVMAKYKKLQRKDVFEPIGFDAFGMHSENYALKIGETPKKMLNRTMVNFRKQLSSAGLGCDWTREIDTTAPEYYQWTQWIFTKLFEKGLAYQKEALLNWCPSCKTVLADEQIENGVCERCKTIPEKKTMKQWFLKITAYAQRLLDGLDDMDWSDITKNAQRNWIGKSNGAKIKFLLHYSSQNDAELTQNNAETPNDTEESFLYKDLSYKIRGAFFKVKKEIGLGHKESIYHNALVLEFKKIGLVVESEKRIDIKYDGKKIGTYQPDLVIEGKIIIELKALPKIGRQQLNQAWTYLKGSDYRLAFLVNFGSAELEIKRMVYDTARDKKDNSAKPAFSLQNSATSLEVFTTRPDTLFGATYFVLSPEHSLVKKITSPEQKKEVEEYIKKTGAKSDLERAEAKEKTGVFTGAYVINPVNNEKIPVWIADYVLMGYGTGAIMAVPAHDERDFEFAKKYNLPIKEVVIPIFGKEHHKEKYRETITALVHRKKDNKFLYLNDNHYKIVAPIIGGIKKGESIKDTAEREVYEETGYKIKFIKKLGGQIESHFFASHKNVWRYRLDQPVLCELLDEDVEPDEISEEEKNKHKIIWLTAQEALERITHEDNKIGLLRYLGEYGVFCGDGRAVDSKFISGLKTQEAIKKMNKWLEENKIGERTINYKLRDWCISRQRYWGPPVPIVYCEKCGAQSVPEKDLPVQLPKLEKGWEPAGDGRGPLAKVKSFMKTKCPKCGGPAEREPDVMDNFLDSAWYFFRYISPRDGKNIFDKKLSKKWLPVDFYVGGNEHAVLHLMYTRFITMFLHDLGLISFNNPFKKFRANGMILKDGKKMSKSKGNIVNPEEYGEKIGYDALKTYILFLGPLSEDRSFSDAGAQGAKRWIEKIVRLEEKVHPVKYISPRKTASRQQGKLVGGLKPSSATNSLQPISPTVLFNGVNSNYSDSENLIKKFHQTIKVVTDDFESQKYNTAIARLMELTNALGAEENISSKIWEKFLILIAPFAPALAEELWEKLGHKDSVFKAGWPEYDKELIKDETINLVVQVNGKLRDIIEVDANISEKEAKAVALESEKIKKWTNSKEIIKVIFVKGRLVNIVVK